MSNPSLYSVTTEIALLLHEVTEAQGEVTPEVEQKLSQVNTLLATKTDNVVQWVHSQEDLITLVDMKLKELAEYKRAVQARLQKFDGYVDACLSTLGTTKLEGALFAIKKRKPTQVVEVFDESLIPLDFVKIPPPPAATISKTDIAKALKANQEVPGARMVESKNISLSYVLK